MHEQRSAPNSAGRCGSSQVQPRLVAQYVIHPRDRQDRIAAPDEVDIVCQHGHAAFGQDMHAGQPGPVTLR